jgi:two-component system, OmpR family, response regulator
LRHRDLKRVLVVDDDPDLLAVVSLALTGLGGYTVQCCDSSAEAVEAAREFEPDLILLDVMMPGLDGYGVLKDMRAGGATRAIPIVFMTAQADRATMAAYEALGCLGIIAKPFDPVALPEILDDCWQLHGRRRIEAHNREFEALRRAYAGELKERLDAMQAAAAALARDGWDRARLESIAQMAHRIAGSSGLYRLAAVSRAALALEGIVNRLLGGPNWPPASFPADLVRLVQAVAQTARSEAGVGLLGPVQAFAAPEPPGSAGDGGVRALPTRPPV